MGHQDSDKPRPDDGQDRDKHNNAGNGSNPWQDQPLSDMPDYAWREHEQVEPEQHQPRQQYHNPQYEWAQGNHSSYPSGRFGLIRWIIPIAIVAMVGIYFFTR